MIKSPIQSQYKILIHRQLRETYVIDVHQMLTELRSINKRQRYIRHIRVTFPTFTSPATSAAIRFGDFPTAKDVRNAENNALPTLYWTDGLISFTGGTLLDGATIAGRVTTAAGQGLRNATVTLIDTAGGRRTTTTSSFGNYQFEGLELGRDYMIVVTSKRYRFATRLVNLTGNLSDVNLIGLE